MKDNCSHLLNKSVMQIVAMLLVFLMLTGCSTNSRSNTITTELKEDGKTALIPIIDEDQAEERSKEAQKYTYEVHASDLKADSIDLSQLGISHTKVRSTVSDTAAPSLHTDSLSEPALSGAWRGIRIP